MVVVLSPIQSTFNDSSSTQPETLDSSSSGTFNDRETTYRPIDLSTYRPLDDLSTTRLSLSGTLSATRDLTLIVGFVQEHFRCLPRDFDALLRLASALT